MYVNGISGPAKFQAPLSSPDTFPPFLLDLLVLARYSEAIPLPLLLQKIKLADAF
jgi:hypothetical protein